MDKVRIGLIGTGGIGQIHLRYLRQLPRTELTCVCDNRKAVVDDVARRYGAKAFVDPEAMITSGLCDAVMICTPHLLHAPLACVAMKAGLHALVEKPMAVRASLADKMIADSKKHGVKLAVMFQRRTEPLWRKARSIVESGALGRLIRTCFLESHFRTQAYYDCGDWRGTWKGEGGGVLVNQSPHSLDSFIWLGGMPKSVTGKAMSRGHDVEVEDVAMALLEYDNGAVGTLYTSTYESPQIRLYQFVGDRATLEIRDDAMRLGVSSPPAGEVLANSDDPWDLPIEVWTDIKVPAAGNSHRSLTENFVAAILDGVPLIGDPVEAARSVELANAIHVSSALGKEVKLPLKRKLFDDLLDGYMKKSKTKKVKAASNRVVIPRR